MPDLMDYTEPMPSPELLTPEAEAADKAEKDLAKRVDEMVEEAHALREQLQNRYVKAVRYWRGEHWLDRKGRKTRGKDWTQATVNRIYPIIEQRVAMLTDNNPRGNFIPTEPDDAGFAKALGDITMHRARQMNLRAKIIRGCHHSELFGYQAAKVFYDDTLNNPDVNVVWIHPLEFLIDPLATGIEDAEYLGTERMVSYEYAAWRWPEKAEAIKQKVEGDTPQDFRSSMDTTSLDEELGNPAAKSDYVSTSGADRKKEMVRLVELYFRDYEEETVEIPVPLDQLLAAGYVVQAPQSGAYIYAATGLPFDPASGPTLAQKRRKYPNGRLVIKIEEIVLVDQPWQGEWPIALGVNIPIPFRWYGMDGTEQLIGRQDVINDGYSRIEDWQNLYVHPRRKVEVGSLANPKTLTNSPDSVILCNPGRKDAVEWEQIPAMPPDVQRLIEMSGLDMENAAGMPSVSMGRAPARGTTATEIMTLDRAGRGRVGMQSALLDEFIARIFFLMGQCIQQNYDVGRIVRIVGPGGQQIAAQMSQQLKTVAFDVEVEPGSTLPYDKEMKKQEAMALNQQLGGAYLPELLDAFEVKNKDEVLQRVSVWQQFQQFQAQQQQMMQMQQEQMAQLQQQQQAMDASDAQHQQQMAQKQQDHVQKLVQSNQSHMQKMEQMQQQGAQKSANA